MCLLGIVSLLLWLGVMASSGGERGRISSSLLGYSMAGIRWMSELKWLVLDRTQKKYFQKATLILMQNRVFGSLG
ncbi:MAG: hypothetical protein Ct9H90mP25_1970 [Gammaproteobacteria bacterium]|nr:MAG: hypothetical protein Ct9H90mP25_1970 [Gammaproteobacteria bacterium]